jgi:regulator of nucleoside diphosphate kinase
MSLPSITMADTDHERLRAVAIAALGHERPGMAASMLLGEVSRAVVVARESLSPDVVGMDSIVKIRDDITKTDRVLHLVYPEDVVADSDVSVLTPLGAALVGLSRGDSIDWCTATGERSSVTVLEIRCGGPERDATEPARVPRDLESSPLLHTLDVR